MREVSFPLQSGLSGRESREDEPAATGTRGDGSDPLCPLSLGSPRGFEGYVFAFSEKG